MYRLSLRVFLGTFLSCIFLASCTPKSTLPPEEVLSRASRATQTMQSARFTMKTDFELRTALGTHAEGTMQANGLIGNGGKDMSLLATLSLKDPESSQESTVVFDLWVLGVDDVYIAIRDANMQADVPLLQPELVAQLVGQAWKLPSAEQAPTSDDITPHPRLLKAQSEVVDVTEDYGIKREDGRDVHRYDVAVNPEKLITYLRVLAEEQGMPFEPIAAGEVSSNLQATGTMSIDAETFMLHSAQWNLASLPLSDSLFIEGTVDIALTDIDTAPAIIPPVDAQPLMPVVPQQPQTSDDEILSDPFVEIVQ